MLKQIPSACLKCPPRVHCCKFKYTDGFVYVGKNDIKNIQNKYNLSSKEFLSYKKLPKRVISYMKNEPRYSEGNMRYHQLKDGKLTILKTKENGDCIFLKKGSCSIYEDRPLVCKIYPYWFERNGEKIDIIAHDIDMECRLFKEEMEKKKFSKSELKYYIDIAQKIIVE